VNFRLDHAFSHEESELEKLDAFIHFSKCLVVKFDRTLIERFFLCAILSQKRWHLTCMNSHNTSKGPSLHQLCCLKPTYPDKATLKTDNKKSLRVQPNLSNLH
jgi:hypothetical protein